MAEEQPSENVQKQSKKGISFFSRILIILIVILAYLLVKILLLMTAAPTISVDYVAEYSKITQPADYEPNQNAAPYYEEAFDALLGMSKLLQSCRQVWPDDMNDTERDMVENYLAANSKALVYIKEAVSKPYYWVQRSSSLDFPGMYSIDLSQELRNFQTAAYSLELEAKLLASQGQLNAALEHIIYIYKIGSHLHRLQGSIEASVGMSFKTIATNNVFTILSRKKLDARMLEHFQKELEREISKNQMELDFQGEKLYVYDFIQRIFTDNGKGDGSLIPRKAYELIQPPIVLLFLPSESVMERYQRDHYLKAFWAAIVDPDRRKTVKMVDEYFLYVETLKHLTPWQLHNRGINSNTQHRDMLKDYYLSQCVPDIGFFYHLIERFQRQKTEESALITTIAILRYKEDKGSLPGNLDQLVSSRYLEHLRVDPYNSFDPLVYKRQGSDFMLYSLGEDFDDDGGVHSRWGDSLQGGDQVFWPVNIFSVDLIVL
jgi:hypothetical protein